MRQVRRAGGRAGGGPAQGGRPRPGRPPRRCRSRGLLGGLVPTHDDARRSLSRAPSLPSGMCAPCAHAPPPPLTQEARAAAEREPVLASFLHMTVIMHASLEKSMAFLLANKLASPTLLGTQLTRLFMEAYEVRGGGAGGGALCALGVRHRAQEKPSSGGVPGGEARGAEERTPVRETHTPPPMHPATPPPMHPSTPPSPRLAPPPPPPCLCPCPAPAGRPRHPGGLRGRHPGRVRPRPRLRAVRAVHALLQGARRACTARRACSMRSSWRMRSACPTPKVQRGAGRGGEGRAAGEGRAH